MAKTRMPINGKLGKEYKVTSPFGWRVHPVQKIKKHHNGTDLWGSKAKIELVVWHDGVVVKSGVSTLKQKNGSIGGVGYFTDIKSKIGGKWYTTRYAHMEPGSQRLVKGQKVQAGEVVGIMGASGEVTGRHLHIEINLGTSNKWTSDGKGFVDPMKFIPATITAEEAVADVKLATPTTDPVAPAPVHGDEAKSGKASTVVKPKTYKVKTGDTLSKIAKDNKTTVAVLAKLNNIKDVNIVKVGQIIKLP